MTELDEATERNAAIREAQLLLLHDLQKAFGTLLETAAQITDLFERLSTLAHNVDAVTPSDLYRLCRIPEPENAG